MIDHNENENENEKWITFVTTWIDLGLDMNTNIQNINVSQYNDSYVY